VNVSVDLEELIAYSEYERGRWREWFAADPQRLSIPFQPGDRFPDIGSLLDHVFLVERRHLSRLQGATVPDSSGIGERTVEALFGYGIAVRADFRRYLDALANPAEIMTVKLPQLSLEMSRRKLATHIVLHEIRHFAQLAYAARVASHAPPGDHDLLFCPEVA
jgi:uncharacterized damage-inducible protein DinB